MARKRRDSAIDAFRRPEINLIAARLAPPIARNLDFGRSILDNPERMETTAATKNCTCLWPTRRAVMPVGHSWLIS